jgi:hypothetical protein
MKKEKIPHYGNSSKILLKIVEWSKPIAITSVTSGAGTAYPSGAPEFISGF